MSNDGTDPRKRKNGEDLDEESLALCLSPPSSKPKQNQQPLSDDQYPSLALSPPAAQQPHWSLHHRHPPLQEAPPQTLPFYHASQAAIGPSHAASALSFPSSVQVSNHIYHPAPLLTSASPTASYSASSSMAAAPPREPVTLPPHRGSRARRNPSQGPRGGKDGTIEPPFPWATDRRAVVHSIDYLLAHGINTISGEVMCNRKECKHWMTLEYDLQEKYLEVAELIVTYNPVMHDRALAEWLNPTFPSCPRCHEHNVLKPVVPQKKRAINWLFMLLGQTLGHCTLEQLKYFCKHNKILRTAAKDRFVYQTFLAICKQLEPHVTTYNSSSEQFRRSR